MFFLFKDLFETEGFGYVDACSFLCLFFLGSERLSELVRLCPWSSSISSLSRKAFRFNPNRFMRRNRERILKKLNLGNHGDFCFAVDDTGNPKYGDFTFGSAPFHASTGPYFGQKILVLVIVDLKTQQALPINYVFLTGKKDSHHVPGHFRAIELLKEALASGFPPLPVTSDSWFDSKEFIKSIHELGCTFAGELKATRLARTNPGPGVRRSKLNTLFCNLINIRLPQTRSQKCKEKRGKAFSQLILFITDLTLPLKTIAVYNRINGTTPFAFYATADTSMTGARFWRFSRARWAIEVLFRDLKQSLGFGSLTSGGEGGAHLAVCIPLILLTSRRLDTKEIWGGTKKETLGTIVKTQREVMLSKSIDMMVHNPNSTKILKLRARPKNPNKKPTNIGGEQKIA